MEKDLPLARVLEAFFQKEADRFKIEVAFLVGSQAAGAARPDSDVDVALMFSDPADSQTLFDRTNEIALRIARDLRAEIDIVVLDLDFSKPMLAYNCIVKGVPLYLRDPASLSALRNEAVRQKEDFSIFGVGWQIAVARKNLGVLLMPDFRYAEGRIPESIAFISEEIREFDDDYAKKTWQEYRADRKLQKLMDRTVENVLTALIEVCGTILTQEGRAAESYAEALRRCGELLGFAEEDRQRLEKLAIQRNRLAHRYLDFRWQAIRLFESERPLVRRLLSEILTREERRKAAPAPPQIHR